jgi:gliding motility-associated-like protein
MGRIKYIFLLIFLFLSYVGFSQQTYFLVDGIQYRTINDYECEVTKRIDGIAYSDSIIVIPYEVEYDDSFYSVVAIGDSAFYNATITTIELHEMIRYIGGYAFDGTIELNIISPSLTPPSVTSYSFVGSTSPKAYVHCESYRTYNIDDIWGTAIHNFRGIEGNILIQRDTTVCIGEHTFYFHNPYHDSIVAIVDTINRFTTITYENRLINIDGCLIKDSLSVNIFPDGSLNERIVYLCGEDNYQATFYLPEHDFYYNFTESDTGMHTFEFPSGNCEDIYEVYIVSVVSNVGNEIIHKCVGQEHFYVDGNGTNRLTTTDVSYTKRASSSYTGCDSLVNVSVIFHDTMFSMLDTAICEGERYLWSINGYNENGTSENREDTLYSTGTYMELLRTEHGCTNRHILNLTVNPVDTVFIYDTICYGEHYQEYNFDIKRWEMSNTINTITKTKLNTSYFSCDSITVLNLFVKPNATTNLGTVNLCRDSIYYLNDIAISTSGTHRDTLSTYLGCDSVVRVTINLRDNIETNSTQHICQGGYYIWQYSGYERGENGALNYRTIVDTLFQAGTYSKSSLLTNYGCGNTSNVELVINPTYSDTIYDTTCYGTPYNRNGFSIPLSQMTNTHSTITNTQNLSSSWGCDSLVTLILTINPTYTTEIYDTIIEGQSRDFFEQTLTQAGRYSHLLASEYGCDSTINLNLFVHLHTINTINASICEGEAYNENGFNLTQAGTYTDTLTSYTGADSIIVLNLVVNPIYNDTITAEICQGEVYTLYNFNESETGVYLHNAMSIHGCDSVFTLNLIVNPTYATNLSAEILEGQTYDFNGHILNQTGIYYDTLSTNKGCDSTFILDLVVHPNVQTIINASICEGETYLENNFTANATGTYQQNLQTIHGADSIVILNLVVNPIYNDTITVEICQGENYAQNGFNENQTGVYTHQSLSIHGCDSLFTLNLIVNPIYDTVLNAEILEGQTYNFNSHQLNVSGTYYDTLQTAKGCDSIFILNLVVHPNVQTLLNAEICNGETYSENGFTESVAGTYYQHLNTIHGADSTVVLDLVVRPTYNDTVNVEICQGEVFTQYGFNETQEGVYTHRSLSVYGCDSLFSINLIVNPIYNDTITAEICQGQSYTEYNFNVNTQGVHTQRLQSVKGCDSLFSVNLIVNPVYDTIIVDSICKGSTYTLNGFNVSEAGYYTQYLQSEKGCDSIVHLNLKTISFIDTIYAHICEGEIYNQNNFLENITGIYVDSLQSYWGCDSVVVLNLIVHPNYNDTIYAQTCDNIPYTLNGFNADTTGLYTQYLQSIWGCDSVVTLNLTVYPTYIFPLNEEICEGEVYIEHGFWLTYPGTFIMNSYTSCHGCDSLYVLNLTVNQTWDKLVEANICQGDTFRLEGYDNLVAWESGTYRDVIPTYKGCDSAKTVMLTVNPTYCDTIYANICQGELYNQHGFNETQAGVYTQVLSSVMGCDSVVVLNLTTRDSYHIVREEEICEGEEFFFHDENFRSEGIYIKELTTIYGCDSIVELHLRVNPNYHDTIYRRLCVGDTYQDENFTQTQGGTYTVQYTSSKGCDSTISLVLEEIYYNNTISAVVCEGETYSENGFNENRTGTYTLNLTTFDGCDSIINLNLYVAPNYNDTITELIRAGETFDRFNFYESERGTYVQNLISQYGCDSVVVLNLDLYGDMLVFVPNSFTPQDRTNYLWKAYPENETVILDELHVFNRNGTLVFSAKDFSQTWDGKYKGNYVPMGAYSYILIYHSVYTPDKKERIMGSINVIY